MMNATSPGALRIWRGIDHNAIEIAKRTPMHILIADDHPLFRDALDCLVRELRPDAQVNAVSSYADLIEHANAHTVDLIIADLHMPDMDAWDGIRQIRSNLPDVPYVIVSASESPEEGRRALEQGASGFIPKTLESKSLINALNLILEQGIKILPPASQHAQSESHSSSIHLTPRQREVLACLAEGDSNKHIARKLGLTEGTVKLHVRAIFQQLDVGNRTQAVIKSRELRLI